MFFDILKVGAVACFSPLQSVLTISIFTHMLASFGTEILAGYGIGARLEFMLTSVSFAFGIASVPMIGMAIGAGRIARARRIAWIAGAVSFVGRRRDRDLHRDLPRSLGQHLHQRCRRARRQPAISVDGSADVRASSAWRSSMYFSSQGAAKVVGPVLAQTARLLFIGTGGWWLSTHDATAAQFLRAGGRIDGGARRAVLRQRGPDAMGTEARSPCQGSAGVVLSYVIPVRCEASNRHVADSGSGASHHRNDGTYRRR